MRREAVREMLLELEVARKRLIRPYFLEIGLTLGEGQPRVLRTLAQQGPMTQRELADACRQDAATMSRSLDRMEEAGLLCREKNPDSRRSYLVSLTPAGREKAELVIAGFRQVDDLLWKGFSEEEMETVLDSLQRMRENLEDAEVLLPADFSGKTP